MHLLIPAGPQLCTSFRGCFGNLCMNKFSSNVMEKCLNISSDEMKEAFIIEIVEHPKLPQLLQDQYANYVVQVLLASPLIFCPSIALPYRPHGWLLGRGSATSK